MALTKISRGLLDTGVSDSSDSTAITIDSSERVGLLTSSPNARLQVLNPSNQETVPAAGAGAGNGVIISNDGNTYGLFLGSIGTGMGYLQQQRTDSATYYNLALQPNGGSLGVGTSSPDGKTDIAQDQNTTAASFTTPHLALTATGTTNTTGFTGISYATSTITNYGWTVGAQRTSTTGGTNAFIFRNHSNSAAGTERMSINSDGEVGIGATAASPFLLSVGSTGNDSFRPISLSVGSTSTRTQISFNNPNGAVGSIVSGGVATSYVTSSDYRLKENVVTDWDATTRLKQLIPSRFNFIAEPNITVDGFLAHEVSDIVPEAITGEKDATEAIGNVLDSDGNVIKENVSQSDANVDTDAGETWQETGTRPVYQGIDQSKLVPLLVKTIQELEARITTLENA